MATFRDREKGRYKELKRKLFSSEAQDAGNYRGRTRSFCLADEYSYENLFSDIRDFAITYFLIRGIPWHDGLRRSNLPSNHLCCSQSCCINFLFPLVKRPDIIKAIFSYYYPEFATSLPLAGDKPLTDGTYPFIAFEWIGTRDYLGEAKRKGIPRTRGANFTSADFTFRFRENDGRIHLVLGEWKYTEEYGRNYKGSGRSGEVRRNNYINFFSDQSGIFSAIDDREKLYDSLFYEPFYQLMRLQLLAQEMEVNKEMDADIVSVLHVCPVANKEFRERVTSPYLEKYYPGKGVLEIWKELIPEDKFVSISVEHLLTTIHQVWVNDLEWVDYLGTRYCWDKPY